VYKKNYRHGLSTEYRRSTLSTYALILNHLLQQIEDSQRMHIDDIG